MSLDTLLLYTFQAIRVVFGRCAKLEICFVNTKINRNMELWQLLRNCLDFKFESLSSSKRFRLKQKLFDWKLSNPTHFVLPLIQPYNSLFSASKSIQTKLIVNMCNRVIFWNVHYQRYRISNLTTLPHIINQKLRIQLCFPWFNINT